MIAIATLLLACSSTSPQTGSESARERLVLRDVRLPTQDLTEFAAAGYVVIEGERILAVGQGEPPAAYAEAEVFEGKGRYLIPGLIDAHVHLGSVLGMNGKHMQAHPELARAWFAQLPRSLLYFGYTTVVELGGRSLALEQLREAELHPDVYDCHFPLVLANGYGMTFEPPETRFLSSPNFLYDPRQADAIPAGMDPEAHSPAATVARVAENGGICVKIHHESGFGGMFDWPTPTPEMIGEVIEEAHGYGMPVVLHANSLEAWEFGADVGVDCFVHGMWHWGELNGQAGLPDRVRAVLDLVLEQEQGFMPTMQVVFGERDMLGGTYLEDPQLGHVVPPELLEWFATPEGEWFREDLIGLYHENREMLAKLGFERLETREDLLAVPEMFLSQLERTVAYLTEHDGRLLFGSDSPSAPMYANPAGYNAYCEMQRLHAAGVSLSEILTAATRRNAQALALDDDLGSIEPGKLAHLLLLAENPLETIDAYDSIEVVVVRGFPVPRETLSASAR